MFLVLIVHADFLSLGSPTAADYVNAPVASFGRVFFEILSIICVNVFVLISGWFTIKPTFKGGFNFLFQCSFMIIGVYCIAAICGITPLHFQTLILQGIFYNNTGFWFIKAYLILYILAPILNTFIANSSKHTILTVLICFLIIQSASATYLFNLPYFSAGYSPLSFIGLYLLAQVIRRHFCNYRTRTAYIFFLTGFALNMIYYLSVKFFQLVNPINALAYTNPLVILQSVGLLMIFNRISIKPNKIINWISASSFAVYLVHIHPAIFEIFKSIVVWIYSRYDSIVCLGAIFVFLCIVFAASVLFDQPRKLIWKFLQRRLFSSPQKR